MGGELTFSRWLGVLATSPSALTPHLCGACPLLRPWLAPPLGCSRYSFGSSTGQLT